MTPAPRLARTLAPATLLLGVVLGVVACGERGPAQPGGQAGGSDPYAGGVSYPWTDQLPSPGSDPYAGGRAYPWVGPGAPTGVGTASIDADTFLSDVDWTPGTASSGWGPIEKNLSNGGQATGDGRTLTLGGQTYTRGLGMHANGEVSYALGGNCSTFTASVGVDDEVGDRGSVVFQVWNGTSTKLYDSGVVRGTDGPRSVNVPVNGVSNLRLVVQDAGDGINYDHADWAAARVTCPPQVPAGDSFVSDLAWSAPTNAWGPIEKDRSNGEQALGDGRTLTLGGQTFAKGLGTHANSSVAYGLGGRCSTLTASVGVDDEVGDRGSVVFQVYLDGVKAYDSGTLRGTVGAQPLNVPLAGKNVLKLVVTDAGDGINHDHADWGNARLSCSGTSAVNTFTYSPIADQPYTVSESQGRAVNGKIYTFGGFDSTKGCCTPTDRAYVYEPATNVWSRLPNMPERGVTHAGMTTDGRSIYYAGGYIANSSWTFQVFGTKAAWRYDVAAQQYSRLPDLPVERAAGQLEYLNGKLHYFGGTNLARTQDVGDHYVLDLANQAAGWRAAAPLPNPRHHMGSAVLNGKIYAVGGQHRHDEQLTTQVSVHAYDPATDTWTARHDLPSPRSHIASSTFVLAGRIVVAGGERAHLQNISAVNAYDPATDTWATLTSLPSPRASGVAAPLGDGFVYATGNARSGWRVTPLP